MVNAKKICFPLSGNETADLNVGDTVFISGKLVTARDKAHQFLFNERPGIKDLPFDLKGSLIYHCGPIVKKIGSEYRIVACGPTTSARVDMYEWWVMQEYGISAIMGKGGMGGRTLDALAKCGGVYLHTIGGAAAFLAEKVTRVIDVFKLEEFGIPEAMWLMEVEDFPAIVTMDSHGKSLHEAVRKESEKAYLRLIGLPGQTT